MNLPSIEKLNSTDSFTFREHPGFTKEIKKFSRKHKTFIKALKQLSILLQTQFDKNDHRQPLGPKHLHNVSINTEYEIWKVNCVATKGLKRKQMPRIYFARRDSEIFYLCMGFHINNYQDSQLKTLAYERAELFFDAER